MIVEDRDFQVFRNRPGAHQAVGNVLIVIQDGGLCLAHGVPFTEADSLR